MGVIEEMLGPIVVPKMVRVRQKFLTKTVEDIVGTIQAELRKENITRRIKKDMRIAVGVGSRGMAEIPLLARTVVEELQGQGAKPFIVPAMGSHGGATAEGQREVLARLGVTEASAGCPIVSSMEVVEVGRLDDGMAVLIDKNALEADGIVVINRIKSHSAYSGPNESGLVKMITIGLGKQKGADSCHALGFGHMARLVVEMAKVKLQKAPFLFGVGTVENADERIARIVVLPAEQIIEGEREFLQEAKRAMPRILPNNLDVLIVDQLGKEFSGSGMDPYVTGRALTPYLSSLELKVSSMTVLDVSESSHGNCCGLGMANITTRRLFSKFNFEYTYANNLTSTVTQSGMIPPIMESDEMAIKAAIKVCNARNFDRLRIVRIPNTLHIGEIYISEAMLDEAETHPDITVLGEPKAVKFDVAGNLTDIGHWEEELSLRGDLTKVRTLYDKLDEA